MKGWGVSEGRYLCSGGGWAREVQCKRRIALDSFLRAANESAAGPAGGMDRVGTNWGLWSGKEGLSFSNGSFLWVISSIGRCFRIVVRGVFHMRGRRAGFSVTRSER